MTEAIHPPNRRTSLLYPNLYTWFLFLSAMDVMLTGVALAMGAYESNPVAAWFLERFGAGGLVLLKFTAVPVVIGLCEYIGRRKPPTGRKLIEWVVALSAVPIVVTLSILMVAAYLKEPAAAGSGG
jgi:hypothetical protein